MDLSSITSVISTVGFPITLVILLLMGFYKMIWQGIIEKNIAQLERVNDVNTELVKANTQLINGMNIKVDNMQKEIKLLEKKMDKVIKELY